MRAVLTAAVLAALAVACTSGDGVPAAGDPTPWNVPPLPENVAGIPGSDEQPVAVIEPHSPTGELSVGVSSGFVLGHCGLVSPVDIDGNLWDPIGGQDGNGGPLTEDQIGELINATSTLVTLTDPNTMLMTTPRGAQITLTRHQGSRRYFLCD